MEMNEDAECLAGHDSNFVWAMGTASCSSLHTGVARAAHQRSRAAATTACKVNAQACPMAWDAPRECQNPQKVWLPMAHLVLGHQHMVGDVD